MRLPDGLLGPDTERARVAAARVCPRNAVTDAKSDAFADIEPHGFANAEPDGCSNAGPHACAHAHAHAFTNAAPDASSLREQHSG